MTKRRDNEVWLVEECESDVKPFRWFPTSRTFFSKSDALHELPVGWDILYKYRVAKYRRVEPRKVRK